MPLVSLRVERTHTDDANRLAAERLDKKTLEQHLGAKPFSLIHSELDLVQPVVQA